MFYAENRTSGQRAIGQERLIIANGNFLLHFDGAENLTFMVQTPADKAKKRLSMAEKKPAQG
ncbi:MAG TPA: hypothetical protein DEF05_00505 [Erwinia sp.]|nr:hypothetical protein [Erwinia sp.]